MKELEEENKDSSQENLDRIERYLEKGANPDCIIPFPQCPPPSLGCGRFIRNKNTTPLVVAIENHRIELIKTLLKYRANININTCNENDLYNVWGKPLLAVIENNCFHNLNQKTNQTILKNLLDHGASLENLDNFDNNIFHILPLPLISEQLIAQIFKHAHFDFKKELPQLHHKIITLLCIFKQKNIPKDIKLLIFSNLPEYFHHRRLYNELFTKKICDTAIYYYSTTYASRTI